MKKLTNILLLVTLILLSCAGNDEKEDLKLRLKYRNLKYMFTIQFPEKWISYMDFEKTEIIDPQLIIPVVYFTLPTRSREWQSLNIPAGYADLFYIRIFSNEQWKLYEERYKGSDEFRLSDRYPGKQKDFVYMIRFSSSIPVDLYIYMKEADSIADTFRMLKDN